MHLAVTSAGIEASQDSPNLRVLHAVRRYGEFSQTFVAHVIQGTDALGWEAWVGSEQEPINRQGFPFPPDSRLLRPSRPSHRRRFWLRATGQRRNQGAAWWEPIVAVSRPTLLHAHFGWIAAATAFERFGMPVIVSFHGSDIRSWPYLCEENRRAQLALLRKLRVAVASSHSIAAEIRSQGYRGHLRVIPPGVRLDEFPFRQPRDFGAAPRLLFVGRQVECKGLDVLIQALPAVLASHPEASLTVVGDGPGFEQHAELVRTLRLGGSVHFRGALPHDEVRAELRAADALVVPSRTTALREAEGSPVAPKEALATGLPVIATICGGLAETVPPRQRAGLVPENDPRALGQAILALLDQPGTWQARAAEGRRWVEQQFDADRLACRLADVYQDVAAGAESGAWPSSRPLGRTLAGTATFASSHRST